MRHPQLGFSALGIPTLLGATVRHVMLYLIIPNLFLLQLADMIACNSTEYVCAPRHALISHHDLGAYGSILFTI